ncbi:hypothetical protein [Prescottella subtropica]|uniref:hypothetical protein n=1 Tax=Prescottella subtropica TaxID=2545757 RepID=UPI0010F6C9CE|nr:hypothetical protein [Prescottella subtropica]
MCKSSNEPGGPYRCSGHARTARDRAAAKVTQLESRTDELDAHLSHIDGQRDALLNKAADEQGLDDLDRLFASIDATTGDTDNLPDGVAELNAETTALQAERNKTEAALQAARADLATREDEYRATPDGIGEAAARAERLAHGYTPTHGDKKKREHALRNELKQISRAEQQMSNEADERRHRWGQQAVPIVRGAFPGGQYQLGPNTPLSRSGMLVHEAGMTGSYTNTYEPDPDGFGDDGDLIKRTRMDIVRSDNQDGRRTRMAVPVYTSNSSSTDNSAPTVREALLSAVGRADRYDADYPTWARNNGYETTPDPDGHDSTRAYRRGVAAHKEAAVLKERLSRFLDDGEYQALAAETRAAI